MSNPAKPRDSFQRWLIKRVIFWSLAAVLIAGVIFGFQRRFLFPREMAVQKPEVKSLRKGLVEVWIDTPDGKVEGWYLPAIGATATRPRPAVIFAHGNAELIEDNSNDLEAYRDMGISVLIPEYRGYGRSAGSPSQDALVADMKKFHDWLLDRPEVDRARIIYHGRSLGGGVLFALAETRPPAVMIVESTFKSVTARFGAYFIPAFLVRDPFDSLAVIKKLDCPILMMHGKQDTIIPHDDAVALQTAAKNARLISFDCGHNDLPPVAAVYWEHIEAFLETTKMIPGGTREPVGPAK
jgi:fermentation-respiration switch protein FrsA (DUF1100 family)